ncbi:MAG TPA: hypothetical protein DGG95_16470 [Cytophagales bacterium]|nr:hypothetical protein [Cytophagales bacterium]
MHTRTSPIYKVVFLLFSLNGIVHAQVKLDSLRTLIHSTAADTTRTLAYCELAYQFYNKNLDSTAKYAQVAKSLATKIQFSKGYGRALRCEAIPFLFKGDHKKAVELLEQANAIAEQTNDLKGIGDSKTALGAIYRNEGDYEKAMGYFSGALNVKKKINDLQGVGTLLNNMGVIYFDIHDFEKALEYYQQAYDLQRKLNDEPGMGRSLTNLGQAHQALRKFNQALIDFKKALQVVEAAGDKRGLTLVYSSLATIYTETHKLDSAKEFLVKGEAICNELGFKDRLADHHNSYAFYYLTSTQPAKAVQHASLAISLSKQADNTNILLKALDYYSQAAYQLGMYKDAFDHSKYRQKIQDSIVSDKVKRNSMLADFNLKQEQIKNELEKNKLEKIASDERHRRIINSFAGVTGTIFVIALFAFVAFRKFRKQNRLLQKQRHELTEQYQAISEQDEELKEINEALKKANDLIELQNKEILENNQTLQKEVEKRTREIIDYNQQLEKFAHLSAHNLRAPVARILGLSNLLKSSPSENENQVLCHLKTAANELDVVVKDLNLILQLQDEQPPLSDVNIEQQVAIAKLKLEQQISHSGATLEEHYYANGNINTIKPYFQFIIYALLDNAIKYRDERRPLQIKIETKIEDGYFLLSIADNGLGLDEKHHPKLFDFYTRFHFHVAGKGLGLYIAKSYADAMKGSLTIESKEGVGCVFTLRLPLASA